ncbi:MFS transporter [Pseudonocardia sp. DSM 110487]|uniref:MFS transporter n=1 Tax=Pseudonocardia sp. DSM 110487 TaxID=2865833 RepID=UPI001C6A821B|nr:MFS transporter [Pseudonocardia sp. DSM 110487]QYN34531.1 MFS transporter [Pseudonocardia sp. DSM 110487]
MTVVHQRPPALATAVLTAGVVVVGAQAFVLAPLLPDIAAGLAASTAEAGRALSAYGAGIVASALLLGRRLDAIPRRTVLLAGMGALTVAAAGSAVASHWALLALAQLAGGIGVGVVLPATYALAAELAPPGAGARATGRVLTGWSIALVAGVPLATVLGDAIGWRAAFGALAALCVTQIALYVLLPATPAVGPTRGALGAALRAPGVAALLTGVLAYMAAFYGVFAFVGVEVRAVHGGGATMAGLVALAYGIGFGIAAGVDRFLDRLGTARLVAPALALLAAVYLALAATIGALALFLGIAVIWGLVNHVGLTLLLSRLAAIAPGLRGAVLALNTAATYGGAAVAGTLAGLMYERAGFGWLAVTAAALLALAVPVTASRKPHSSTAALDQRDQIPGPR